MYAAERDGKPGVTICNRAYANIVRSMARVMGLQNYEFVELRRLLATLSDSQVEEAAEAALDSIIACLIRES